MPTLVVKRSVLIEQTPAVLAESLTDFRRWPLWSPWLCQEPDAKVTYEGDKGATGSGYAWDGVRVGAGRMQLVDQTSERINYELTFLKPWKSEARVAFDLDAESEGHTQVTWSMRSSLPFFLFFMRRSFETFVGLDYERGLRMLKELEETGTVLSRSELATATASLPACHYLALDASGSLSDISSVMEAGYATLEQQMNQAGIQQDGAAFCHYTKMNPMRDQWTYTMGIPVNVADSTQPTDSLDIRERAAMSPCVHVAHHGRYEHLGNAWATAFGAIRANKQKHARRIGGFEIYQKMPSSPDAGDAVTDIMVPLR